MNFSQAFPRKFFWGTFNFKLACSSPSKTPKSPLLSPSHRLTAGIFTAALARHSVSPLESRTLASPLLPLVPQQLTDSARERLIPLLPLASRNLGKFLEF
ncbi:hypothetical protein LXL04_019220 [Taraxacum kok-saghyz]